MGMGDMLVINIFYICQIKTYFLIVDNITLKLLPGATRTSYRHEPVTSYITYNTSEIQFLLLCIYAVNYATRGMHKQDEAMDK